MIVGSALATTVPARIATNMPAISPDMAWSICRLVMAVGGAASGACVAVTVVSLRDRWNTSHHAPGDGRDEGWGGAGVRWGAAPGAVRRLPGRGRQSGGEQVEHLAEHVGEGQLVRPFAPVLHAHPHRGAGDRGEQPRGYSSAAVRSVPSVGRAPAASASGTARIRRAIASASPDSSAICTPRLRTRR